MQDYLRTFRPYKIEEVKQHIIILGDLSSDCGACRCLGIDIYTVGVCPECGTPFKYVASRRVENHPGERFQIIRRLQEKRPDLVLIDYGDYTRAIGHKKARDFFG